MIAMLKYSLDVVFLIYLYENVRKALNNKESIFNYDNGKLILKDNIEFIFYSSQLPCGDASIIIPTKGSRASW